MNKSEIKIQVLEPTAKGFYLTQSNLTEDKEDSRTFSTKVFLAQGATAEEWEEWTEAQKTEWEDAHCNTEDSEDAEGNENGNEGNENGNEGNETT